MSSSRTPILYLIGSLRNPEIPAIGVHLRSLGYEVFDDWYAAGRIADDSWRDYEIARGHSYSQALTGWAARHVFEFDFYHLNRADLGVLVLPAGKSCHLELGYLIGQGKPGYILLDPKWKEAAPRYDVMYCFAKGVYETLEDLSEALQGVWTPD